MLHNKLHNFIHNITNHITDDTIIVITVVGGLIGMLGSFIYALVGSCPF